MDLSAIQAAVRACLAEQDCGTTQGTACAEAYADQLLQALQVIYKIFAGFRSFCACFTVEHPAVTHSPDESCI